MKDSKLAARLIFLAYGLGISAWAPMVPIIKDKMQFDDSQLGMILLLFGLGSMVMMPLTGWFIHRFGSRRMIIISISIFSILLPFIPLFSNPYAFSIILFLFGAASGVVNVSINAQAVEIEEKSQSPLMSSFHCLASVGGLFGALIISGLLEFKWPLPLCALTVSFVVLALLVFQKKHLLSFDQKQSSAAHKKGFKFPGLNVLFLGIICFVSFVAEGSMLNWSAEFLHASKGYSSAFSGLGYALFSISMAFGRLIGGRLIERFNIYFVFQTGCVVAALGFLMVVYLDIVNSEMMGFCLIGLGAANIVPILFSSTGRISGTSSDVALTTVTTLGYMGSLLGPAFIGFLAETTSLSFAFANIALLFIGVGLCGKLAIPAPVLKGQI